MENINKQYDELLITIERIIHKYNQIEKKVDTYGNDIPLTCTEVHILNEIGKNPKIGVKAIAVHKGVTEGAVSQIVKKLIRKGLVYKAISKESESRVELTLTEIGKISYENHRQFHKEANQKWYKLFDEYSGEDYQKIASFLTKMDELMSEKGE